MWIVRGEMAEYLECIDCLNYPGCIYKMDAVENQYCPFFIDREEELIQQEKEEAKEK